MEIVTELTNNPVFLYLPVALVILGVILVFTFGFKSAEQPPFAKITNDDRKPAGKKRKIKEKKSTPNGVISSGEVKHEKSPAKETKKSPAKDAPETPKQKKVEKQDNKLAEKNKKNEAIKSRNIEDVKNKKNLKKNASTEKPVDFDEGDWETVPTKADKKKKQEQSPAKKEKKSKKVEKILEDIKVDKIELDKLVKEVVNKELREKEKDAIKDVPKEEIIEEPVVIIEEKKEKKKEKKVKKEIVEKPVEVKQPEPPKEVPKPKAVEKVSLPEAKVEASKTPAPSDGGVAFDELGDVWTEAKAAKKSKKKARRDN